jgi:hypothetical protein
VLADVNTSVDAHTEIGCLQVLTHIREKLQFVSNEAARLAAELADVEAEVTAHRAKLATSKKVNASFSRKLN